MRTNKLILLGVLFAFVGETAWAQKASDQNQRTAKLLTREYLLAHGFSEVASNPGRFERKHIRLGDVSQDLEFPLHTLHPVPNQRQLSDIRRGIVHGFHIRVHSEVRDTNGQIVEQSLDSPDALCSVYLSLNRPPTREHLKTDSTPQLRLKSVVMPENKLGSWQITFQLVASGTKPVAIPREDFWLRLTRDAPISYDRSSFLLFPEHTPETIVVSPGKPMDFTVEVPPEALPKEGLPPGECNLMITISSGKRHRPEVDYEWEGRRYSSDTHAFVVK